ncbi:DegT/DnrJ/EryC1/StrS family aminotransferase [bacterium]|nr:DegT/DnrJ/EryC1/StrS family aminotransferase [bacterium]
MCTAAMMDQLIAGLSGVEAPRVTPDSKHVYWKYCLRIDPERIEGGVDRFAKELKARGIFSAPRYIQKPAFMCQVLRDRVTFGKSRFPFEGPHRAGLPPVEYRLEEYPGAVEALSRVCVLPWNEFYSDDDVRFIADAVIEVAELLRK